MVDISERILDAESVLRNNVKLNDIKIKLTHERYFSKLYEIEGVNEHTRKWYILKISTTNKSCKNEYLWYIDLERKKIRTLSAVYYSEKYNYLITRKAKIIEFNRVLKRNKSEITRKSYFYKLGVFLRKISNETGNEGVFNDQEYNDYLLPKIDSMVSLDNKEKSLLRQCIDQLLRRNLNKKINVCLVNDFALGNLHLDDSDEFVVVDLGDATLGNEYNNISYIKLNLKFGSLSHYFDFGSRSEVYFQEFLRGYNLADIDRDMLLLYEINNLILMISFIEKLSTGASIGFRRFLSKLSNIYLIWRYKRYLMKILTRQDKSVEK